MEETVLPWIDVSVSPQDGDCNDGSILDQADGTCVPLGLVDKPHDSQDYPLKSRLKDSPFSHDAPRALFLIRFREDVSSEDLSIDLFKEWLRSTPAAVEQVIVEAGFKSWSTIVLISLPLSMTSYIPRDLAIVFLGPIKSSIMVPGIKPIACPLHVDGVNHEWTPRKNEKENETVISMPKKEPYSTHRHAELDEERSGFYVSEPAAPATEKLEQNIGAMNWQRQPGDVNIRHNSTVSKAPLKQTVEPVFTPLSVSNDSGIGSSIHTGSRYPASPLIYPASPPFSTRVRWELIRRVWSVSGR